MKGFTLIASLIAFATTFSYAASFNCEKASTTVEKMICDNSELSRLDNDLNVEYKAHLSQKNPTESDLVSRQRLWLARRNECTDKNCIRTRYLTRISELTEHGISLQDLASRLEIPGHSKNKNPELCGHLLDSLRHWKGVTIVAPSITAENIDSGALQKEFGECSPKKFSEHYAVDHRVWMENNLDSVPEEEREDFGIGFAMNKGFRLYHVDIDNDSQNGIELVLYGAGVRRMSANDDDIDVDLSFFNVLDKQNCKIANRAQVADVMNKPDTFVGILEFEEKNYVFDARHYPLESLWGVRFQLPRDGRYFATVCNFVAKDK
jgi:uncharacterized protein YecT (DUF1311 family)